MGYAGLGGRYRRVVITSPRPRAKWCGFYAPPEMPPSRATAGLAGGKWCIKIMRFHTGLCGNDIRPKFISHFASYLYGCVLGKYSLIFLIRPKC